MSHPTQTFRLRSSGAWGLTGLVGLCALALCYMVSFGPGQAYVPSAMVPAVWLISVLPVALLIFLSRRAQRLGFATIGPDGLQHGLAMHSAIPWHHLDSIALETRPVAEGPEHGLRRAILHLSGGDLRPYARVPLKDPTRLSVDVEGARKRGDKPDIEALIAAIETFHPVSRWAT
ncbi:hypothetical protein [Halovulum sp. GXIMD14793]